MFGELTAKLIATPDMMEQGMEKAIEIANDYKER